MGFQNLYTIVSKELLAILKNSTEKYVMGLTHSSKIIQNNKAYIFKKKAIHYSYFTLLCIMTNSL